MLFTMLLFNGNIKGLRIMKDTKAIISSNDLSVALGNEARATLQNTIDQLKNIVKSNPNDIVFFPNGIERIYIEITATLTSSITGTVKLEIAGKDGVKGGTDQGFISHIAA